MNHENQGTFLRSDTGLAMANLAEMPCKVTVTVKTESEAGFDKSKLNNGVLEPLREANLIR